MNQIPQPQSLNEITALIDEIIGLDKRIEHQQAQVDLLKETRAGVAMALQSAMNAGGSNELASRLGSATISTRTVFSVEPDGWPKLYARIVRTGEFDLLTKRLSSTAMRERSQAGDLPEGVRVTALPVLTVKGK